MQVHAWYAVSLYEVDRIFFTSGGLGTFVPKSSLYYAVIQVRTNEFRANVRDNFPFRYLFSRRFRSAGNPILK